MRKIRRIKKISNKKYNKTRKVFKKKKSSSSFKRKVTTVLRRLNEVKVIEYPSVVERNIN